MNVPYSWLQEFLPEVPEVEKVVETLAGLGLGVEDVRTLPASPKGVIVVKVESLVPIEGSNLHKAQLSDGNNSYNVVTAAPNVKVGMLSALAKEGAELPNNLQIAKRSIAGVESEGVVCSPKELGLYDYGGGLIEFSEDNLLGQELLGQELKEFWAAETVIELEITPNRADAISIWGVARDLIAKLKIPYENPTAISSLGDTKLDSGLEVEVQSSACKRFTLRLIEDITIKPSPIWLQHRLASVGLRPRNNVVDITNYVTYELGQPSHAYDKNILTAGKLVVRKAKAGETLTALDEKDYELITEDLLITTPNDKSDKDTNPIGIAGIIGGLNHSINDNTKAVALEVAHFDPVAIRKTAKRHGLSTDASYRFERGVDPNLPPIANARAAQLIAELADGKLHPALLDWGEKNIRHDKIVYDPARVHFLMGIEIPNNQQKDYLTSLGCTINQVKDSAIDNWKDYLIALEYAKKQTSEVAGDREYANSLHSNSCYVNSWYVTPPSWRFDLNIAEDLIEEVTRLHGYEHIGESVPHMHFIPSRKDSTHRNLRNILVAFGLTEARNYSFTSEEELAKCFAPKAVVTLKNPQSVERSVLRTMLYPNMLLAAQNNHTEPDLAFFEIGNVFNEVESERLCILMRGDWQGESWLKGQKLDFYLFKGLVEKLASTLGATFELKSQKYSQLHPGASANIYWQGKKVGFLGKLHPQIATAYELTETYLAELDLPLIGSAVSFSDYSRQPFAERDLAIIVPDMISYAELVNLVTTAAGDKLISLKPFDVYKGNPIPEDKHSIALRLQFRHPDRALRDHEIDSYMTKIISVIVSAGYNIRD